ncbi:MAG: MOFRL family protein [Limnohabitans sp.]|uniref:MOFRL family protein n=1 Tax=Limnohabitans sp. TaxID=1907725 RepID=UPI00391C5EC2
MDDTDGGCHWRDSCSPHGAAHPEPGLCAGGEPRASHDANDSHEFLQALGDSVITGPTLTNVNDFRVVLINE